MMNRTRTQRERTTSRKISPSSGGISQVPRGLETKIGDKLDHLRELNERARKAEKGDSTEVHDGHN
jgi:hypothetical protein